MYTYNPKNVCTDAIIYPFHFHLLRELHVKAL
jgi:hypothetical protein